MKNSASRFFLPLPANDLHKGLHTSLWLYWHCRKNVLIKVVALACKCCRQGAADEKKKHKLERPDSFFPYIFLSGSYFRTGSNRINVFLELKIVTGALLSGFLSLTADTDSWL